MKFVATPIDGVFVIEPEPIFDERGFFARTLCRQEFATRGLIGDFPQSSISWNGRKGTLRGMHFQHTPHAETKLVRCTRGEIFDVAIDLRRDSPSYGKWFGAHLSDANCKQLYIPAGCAHGFQVISNGAEVLYMIDTEYAPQAADGVRWDDPFFKIEWPEPVSVIAERDRICPDWEKRV